jgi:hypothetical protein
VEDGAERRTFCVVVPPLKNPGLHRIPIIREIGLDNQKTEQGD